MKPNNVTLTLILILGILSDNTWKEIEKEIIKFKELSDITMSDSDGEEDIPQVGHSQSDLFIYKQSVSDKMVADCVESLIGTYVYVSIFDNNVLHFFNYNLF